MREIHLDPRELQAHTQLLRSDRVEAVVVAADGLELAYTSAGTVVEYLAHTLNRDIPLLLEEEYDAAKRYKRRHVLAFGGFGNHRLLSRLYTQGCHYCDERFPGTGGYVIRTMHDADRNVIMLCGGDEKGWNEGTLALCDILTGLGDRLVVPSTNCVVSRLKPTPPTRDQIPQRLRELARMARDGGGREVLGVLLGWLGRFDHGGDLLEGTLFRAGFDLLQEMERRGELDRDSWTVAPEQWLGRMVRFWRNAETRSLFGTSFRTRFATFLLECGMALDEKWAWEGPGPHREGRSWSGAALAYDALAQYLGPAYDLPEASVWRRRAQDALAADLREALPSEPSAAGQSRLLLDVMMVASGLDPGSQQAVSIGRVAGEWIGTYWPPGGTGLATFGPEAAPVSEVRQVAGRALWLQGPDRPAAMECLHALEGPYVPGAHYPPGGLFMPMGERPIGIRWLGPCGLRLIAEHPSPTAGWEGRDPRLLHAGASLRVQARTHGEFVLIGGSRLPHDPHADTQALLGIEYASRPFLVDLPSLGPGPEVHGGVTFSLDGRPCPPPRLARAVAFLHTGRLRLVASETMDPGCPIWLRTVCHLPGRGFLLIDRVTPEVAGSMVARFTFPLVGEPTDEGGGRAVVLQQSDAAIWLEPYEPGSFSIETRKVDASPLPGIAEVHLVGWERHWEAQAGVPVIFVTQIRLHAVNRRRALLLEGAAGGPWVCALPNNRRTSVGLDWPALGVEGLEAEAVAYVVDSHLWFAGLRRLATGNTYIEASGPCGVLVDAREKLVRVTTADQTDLYISHEGEIEALAVGPDSEVELPMAVPLSCVEQARARAIGTPKGD